MRSAEEYRGREQTYLKHFFLERYLERVAYNIGSAFPSFVYVDGFSGPWRSENEAFEDTSFMIAIRQLRAVRDGVRDQLGKDLKIRCLFIEKDPVSFASLKKAVEGVTDLETKVLHGSFEDLVPDVVKFVGSSFSLVFIDPTGWTGFALSKITPILKLRGEVLVNFMFNHINWLVEDQRPEQVASFHDLFGGPPPDLSDPIRREEVLVTHYAAALKKAGGFRHATFTRILWPLEDRTYFHLVYCTRNAKGLLEFRASEKKLFDEQHKVRAEALHAHEEQRTGQLALLTAAQKAPPQPFVVERSRALQDGEALITARLTASQKVKYEDLRSEALELSLFWEKDLKDVLAKLRTAGRIVIENMGPRERTAKEGHVLVWQ